MFKWLTYSQPKLSLLLQGYTKSFAKYSAHFHEHLAISYLVRYIPLVIIEGDVSDPHSEISYIFSSHVPYRSSSTGQITLNADKSNDDDLKFLEFDIGILNQL